MAIFSPGEEGSTLKGPIRFAAWWATAFVLWLLFTSSLDPQELVAGVLASSIAAFAASIVQAKEDFGFRPRLPWFLRARILPRQVVADCWLLTVVLWKRVVLSKDSRGSFKTFPFEHVGGDPESAARRALVTAAISLTPNTYVVAFDRDKKELIVHQLVAKPESVEEVLGR
jgi:multisubunit Na+/H+ antiporter MnhE subunit